MTSEQVGLGKSILIKSAAAWWMAFPWALTVDVLDSNVEKDELGTLSIKN